MLQIVLEVNFFKKHTLFFLVDLTYILVLKLTSKNFKWTSCWITYYLKVQLIPFSVGSTYGKYGDATSGGGAIDTYAC